MCEEKDEIIVRAESSREEALPSLSEVLNKPETAACAEISENSEENTASKEDNEAASDDKAPEEPEEYEEHEEPEDEAVNLHINAPREEQPNTACEKQPDISREKQHESGKLQLAGVIISALTLCTAAAGLFAVLGRLDAAEEELNQKNKHIESLEAEKNALEADYIEAMNVMDEPSEPEVGAGLEAEDGKILIYENSVGYAWVPILSDIEQNTYKKSGFSVDERNRMSYTDENGEESSYFGIDVSSYQGDIDWELVREDGVEFAFIRAGYRGYGEEGRLCEDEKFAANYDGAHSVGIDAGVYFFSQATTPEEATEEANFVLEILDGRPLEYPVVFDWETIFVPEGEDPPRTEDVMPQTLTLSAIAFCETIEDAGYKSMIYTNKKQAVLKYDLRQLKKYPIWFAYYNTELNYCYGFDVWQYGTGFVDGIEGEVDVNIAMID